MSLVKWNPPTGRELTETVFPSWKTAISVSLPPTSIITAPDVRS